MGSFKTETTAESMRAKLLRTTEPGLARFGALAREQLGATEVWVFGSRARGDEQPWSDWDLLVVFDDGNAERAGDEAALFRLSREAGLVADVVGVTASNAWAARDVPNTLMYVVSREGVRVAP